MSDTRTCNSCGWVHFGMTREHAEMEVARFNAFYDEAEDKIKEMYGYRSADIHSYEHCFRCSGSYTNFRDSRPGDCPDGCTIQPIIYDVVKA